MFTWGTSSPRRGGRENPRLTLGATQFATSKKSRRRELFEKRGSRHEPRAARCGASEARKKEPHVSEHNAGADSGCSVVAGPIGCPTPTSNDASGERQEGGGNGLECCKWLVRERRAGHRLWRMRRGGLVRGRRGGVEGHLTWPEHGDGAVDRKMDESRPVPS